MTFVLTSCNMAWTLVKKVSKLQKPDNSPIKVHAYYRNIDEK